MQYIEFNPIFMMACLEEVNRAGLNVTLAPHFSKQYQIRVMITWSDPLEMLAYGA